MASQPRIFCSEALSAALAASISTSRASSSSPRPRPRAEATSARRITGETIGSSALKWALKTLGRRQASLTPLLFDEVQGTLGGAPGSCDLVSEAIELGEGLLPFFLL